MDKVLTEEFTSVLAEVLAFSCVKVTREKLKD